MTRTSKERYFDLHTQDQADLLRSLAPVMGRRTEILEKDIWLCQVLDLLFCLPCCKPMAFKGGTSLSKVYQAIDRFSEDIGAPSTIAAGMPMRRISTPLPATISAASSQNG